ncbi:MAG: alpha/beta hydrolase, partial [Allomuricauda sp.]
IYTAGAGSGGRYANLVPILSKDVSGAISIGASITNTELLSIRRPFHFIGIVNKKDYNYPGLLSVKKILDRYRFPNQVLIHSGDKLWPDPDYLKRSLRLFTLAAMRKQLVARDSSYIEGAYNSDVTHAGRLKNSLKLLMAEQYLGEMMGVYGAYKNLDSLRMVQRDIRRNKMYRSMKRSESAAFLKESLLKEDYLYYMEEDLLAYNFNNLGWWNFQRTEINKFIEGSNKAEKDMGHRLLGYINALAEDNIDIVQSEDLIDEDALAFLFMLKTILEPDNFDFYMKIISLSSKNEDFGTALFYLEEAFKRGFSDKETLYGLEHTALLRINPKFNKLVSEYLKDARYNIKEQ